MIVFMVALYIGVIGLCLGSFVNALVWRIKEQENIKTDKPKDVAKKLRVLSVVNGRSICPNCKNKLAAKDLIPILSWLSLSGKCRYCKSPISKQYPLVELLVAVVAVISYLVWPYAGIGWSYLDIFIFVIWLVLLTGLMALVVYDLKWRLLPDRIVFPLTWLGLVFITLLTVSERDYMVAGNALLGGLLISGMFYALYQLSNGKWIGGGDVKLGVLLGLLAGGYMQAMLLLFLASVFGTLHAVLLAVTGKHNISRKTQIPFGPFLITASIAVLLAGESIINWYSNLILSV